jgi:NitT/TauT family transport system permease protein
VPPRPRSSGQRRARAPPAGKRSLDLLWAGRWSRWPSALACGIASPRSDRNTPLAEAVARLRLALITMLRVFVLIALASLVWVPIGVWVGTAPRARADRAADRAVHGRVSGEPAVSRSRCRHRDLEAQSRYLAEPADDPRHPVVHPVQRDRRRRGDPGRAALRGAELRRRGWLWWRKVALPGVLPFYVTGAITASGGSWNAASSPRSRQLGRHLSGARARRLYRRGDRRPATFTASCSASR